MASVAAESANVANYYIGFIPNDLPEDVQSLIEVEQVAATAAHGFKECAAFEQKYGLPGSVNIELKGVWKSFGVVWVEVNIEGLGPLQLERSYGRWHLTLSTSSAPKFITNAVQHMDFSPTLLFLVNKTVSGTLLCLSKPQVAEKLDCTGAVEIAEKLGQQQSSLASLEAKNEVSVGVLKQKLVQVQAAIAELHKERDKAIGKYMDGKGKPVCPSDSEVDRLAFQNALQEAGVISKKLKGLKKGELKDVTDKLRVKYEVYEPVNQRIRELKKKLKECSSNLSAPIPTLQDLKVGYQQSAIFDIVKECNEQLRSHPQEVQNLMIPAIQQLLTVAYCHQSIDHAQFACEYRNFLHTHSYVKITDLGQGDFSAKVASAGAPDDKVYKDFPVLQRCLPRGFTVLDNGLRIFGLHKFGGANDEVADGEMEYEEADTSKLSFFLSTYKANGGSMLWTFYEHPETNTVMIAVGSKNIRRKGSFEEFMKIGPACFDNKTTGDLSMADRMAKHLWLHFLSMDPGKRALMTLFCVQTGLTMIAEFEDIESQHITLLTETRIVLIGVNSPHLLRVLKVPIAHPMLTHLLGKIFGFTSVVPNLNFRPPEEFVAVRREICKRIGDEGDVLLLFNKDGTLDQVKDKTAWYVMLRALRQILGRASLDNVDEYIDARVKKFKLPSAKGFLPLTNDSLDFWSEHIMKPFARYVISLELDYSRVCDLYPCLFKDFKDAAGISDNNPRLYETMKLD
jgi:hypothetical protein